MFLTGQNAGAGTTVRRQVILDSLGSSKKRWFADSLRVLGTTRDKELAE